MTDRRPPRERRAAVLVVTMVCLLIATSITAAMVAASVRDRRQAPVEAQARQAELLAAAGLERALAALAQDSTYEGEAWAPALPAGLADAEARVEIAVTPEGERLRIESLATYSPGGDRTIRRGAGLTVSRTTKSPEE